MSILKTAQQTKALAEAATPGPWGTPMNLIWRTLGGCRDVPEADEEFIAHARTAAPQLADAVIEIADGLQDILKEGERFREDAVMDWDYVQDVARVLLAKLEGK